MMQNICFLVYPGFEILDLTGPLSAFDKANTSSLSPKYRIWVASLDGGVVASSSGLEVVTTPIGQETSDTFIVVGGTTDDLPAIDGRTIATVRRQAAAARRVASVCTGVFLLAEAGLLEGRTVTTHWRCAAALQRRYPGLSVEGDRIFVKDGNVWTSAGITSGIDLALALIEEDLGIEASRATARSLVVYHRRPGGQSQFSALLELDPPSDRFRSVLTYVREHIDDKLSIETLASVACLSARQFSRSFTAETGETPAKAVERLRAEAARERIEDGMEPIEIIAKKVGFGDPERMRRAFMRLFGHPPQSLRRLARAA